MESRTRPSGGPYPPAEARSRAMVVREASLLSTGLSASLRVLLGEGCTFLGEPASAPAALHKLRRLNIWLCKLAGVNARFPFAA